MLCEGAAAKQGLFGVYLSDSTETRLRGQYVI